MPSKFCPKCGVLVRTSNHTFPNYCPWGCGSLKDQPLIPDNADLLEYLKVMRNSISRMQEETNKENTQLKLF